MPTVFVSVKTLASQALVSVAKLTVGILYPSKRGFSKVTLGYHRDQLFAAF